MENNLLKIQNLKAGLGNKEILKDINLVIKKGECQALLGPNASGKSTLAQVILGNPKYKVIKGKILFEGKDITNLPPEKRVKLGIILSFQNPPSIKGVKLKKLVKAGIEKELKIKEAENLLERDINLGFSGGEKKISELMQILSLKQKLIIFDEIDSGLDIQKVKLVSKIIREKFILKGISTLIITHSGQILNYLKPNKVSVMLDGKIICEDDNFKKVIKTIKIYGYEKCRKCQFSSGRP